jgi:kynurenine formamidase
MKQIWDSLKSARVIDLSQPMFVGMPQSPNHVPFRMTLDRRHGDAVSQSGGSASNEVIVTGCHVGTHIDALAHVSFQKKLFGGIDASSVMSNKGFSELGIDTVAPFLTRGIFLDIAKLHGVEILDSDYEITVEDIESALSSAGLEIEKGDVVLIGSGWAKNWDKRDVFQGQTEGAPGIGSDAATWLAKQEIRACGAETIAFERIPRGAAHRELPVHRIFLVEYGIHIIETMNLTELALSGATEFLFVLSPLNIVGATGSPARPLAVVFK